MENTINTYQGGLMRTWGTLKRLLIENQKVMLMGLGGYAGFWLVLGLLLGVNEVGINVVGQGFYIAFSLLSCVILASLSFADFKSKEGRLRALMLPSSIAEKYWPRLIFAFVLVLIPVIIGYWAFIGGDLFGALITGKKVYVVSLSDISFQWEAASVIMTILTFLMYQSYYFMGAILWPKYSFIKSTAIGALVSGVLITLLAIIFSNVNLIIYNGDITESWADGVAICLQTLAVCAFSLVAYFKLKRISVI